MTATYEQHLVYPLLSIQQALNTDKIGYSRLIGLTLDRQSPDL